MPINLAGYNVGTDAAITIADQYGDVFPVSYFGHLVDFDSKLMNTKLSVIPITNGGVPIFQTIWGGVQGSMRLVRVNGAFAAMFLELANAYHTQGLITQLSMSLNVLNRDGTVDEYLFNNMQFSDPNLGNFRNTKEVDMSVNFEASQEFAVGNVSTLLTNLPIAA